jgi:peptidoglycan lytic transglycosylase G
VLKKLLKSFLRFFSDCFTYGAILLIIFAMWGWFEYGRPGSLAEKQIIYIEKGDSFSKIAQSFEDKNIIPSKTYFAALSFLRGVTRQIQPGEYEIPAHASVQLLHDIILNGKRIAHKFLVKEGDSVAEVSQMLLERDNLVGDISEDIPEGCLLPDTYYYQWSDNRQALIKRMQKAMKATLVKNWEQRQSQLNLQTAQEALILASIVEKEARKPAERPIIASVFLNRLKLNMPLQADPTVVYAMTKGKYKLERPLFLKDLKLDDPYNTYRVKGLPPGPICNPGKAAIEAVVAPEDTKFLYFVVDGTGGHIFASNLKDHRKNVNRWRKIKKLNKNA